MVKIHLNVDQGTPQYSCSSCSNCRSVYGTSFCHVKNRGCCWYFPKLTLYDIQKMSRDTEGLDILETVYVLPNTKVFNYYTHAKGYFDETAYKKYIKDGQTFDTEVMDKTIFFRACPFVNSGKGCTLPAKYRSYVCNFYICSEITGELEKHHEFKNYIKERDNYVKWIQWENNSLEMLLKEAGLNLAYHFHETVNFLSAIPLENYEFPKLESIEVEDEFNEMHSHAVSFV